MFRKIISNLSFSPSLVGELGFYAKQLKHEERIRLFGLAFTVLALIIHSIAALSPPESANNAHANDMLYGGVSSQADLLTKYDRNEQNIRDIMTSLGITRSELQQTNKTSKVPNELQYIGSKLRMFSHSKSEHVVTYAKSSGEYDDVYFAKNSLVPSNANHKNTTDRTVFTSTSAAQGTFAIDKASGNILLEKPPVSSINQACAAKNTADATTTTLPPSTCDETLTYNSSVFNDTQQVAAPTVVAQSSDRITYTLKARNTHSQSTEAYFTSQLTDALEYADLIDTKNGVFDQTTKSISWAPVTVMPGETVSRSFSMRLKSTIPATALGVSNPLSYDCTMTHGYGDVTNLQVKCPTTKTIESLAAGLPTVTTSTNLALGGGLALLVIYFYLRARQQREELRLIRKDINTGSL